MLRCAVWAAVSSEVQAGEDKASIPDQQRVCELATDKLGGRIVSHLVVNESRELIDFSGVVTCGKCDRKMACVAKFGAVKRKNGTVYSRAVCKCRGCRRVVSWLQIERALVEWFDALPQELPDVTEDEGTGLQTEHDRVQTAIDGIERAKTRAFDAYVRELTDELTYLDTKKRLESEERALQDRLHLIRLEMAQWARKQPTAERYEHVRDVGLAMLERGKTDPATVNTWLREYVHITFDEDREFAISIY